MADTRPSYIVPATEQPSFWNDYAKIGGLAGFMIASGTGMLGFGSFIGALPGAVIGGLYGKSKMEEEHNRGKVVSPPTFWNRKALIGGLAAAAVVLTITYFSVGLLTPIVANAFFSAAAINESFMFAAGSIAMTGLAASAVAGAIGTFIGGKSGERKMAQEYAAAEAYHAAQQGHAPALGAGREIISPELTPTRSVASQVEYPQNQRADGKSWVEATRPVAPALGVSQLAGRP